MKFKFAFKVHSDLLTSGTKYVIEMPGLVKVKAEQNTLAFLFEYEENPIWKYLPTTAIITGWNDICLDGDEQTIILTANDFVSKILEQTEPISGKEYYNFSTNSYLIIPNTSSLGSSSSWEQQWHITTTDSQGHTAYSSQYICSGNNNIYADFGIAGNTWKIFLCSSGSSWNIVNGAGNDIEIKYSKEYLVNMSFNGTEYNMSLSPDFGDTWIDAADYSSTTKVRTVASMRVGNTYDKLWPWQGTIILDKFSYIKADGNTLFDGATAVEGTDFTNNNNVSSRNITTYKVKYPTISTGELKTYQSWLYLKDIIARKITD